MKPRVLTLAAVGTALAMTAAVTILPFFKFAYRNPTLHVMLETSEGLIALVVAYLVFGRFRERRGLADLTLVLALVALGTTNLLFVALTRVTFGVSPDVLTVWGALLVRLLGAALFAASSLMWARTVKGTTRAIGVFVTLAGLGVLGLIAAAVVLLQAQLPGIGTNIVPFDLARPSFSNPGAVMAIQGLGGLLFGVAAWGFTKQAEDRGDALLRWFGAGAAIAAVARVNYLLFPSLYTQFVYTGDVLRLIFYIFLLVGAVSEIRGYWRRLADLAVVDERRRIARDLHDGMAQELAFISSQTRQLARRDGNVTLHHIADASDRALDESRRAIAALTTLRDEPLDVILAQTVEDLAHRLGVKARVESPPGVEVDAETKEALIRIVGEAVNNAVRHGGAGEISIHLSGESPQKLRITDDGAGFDVTASRRRSSGFGLTSMEERARAIGGELSLTSQPGKGSEIEVVLPPSASQELVSSLDTSGVKSHGGGKLSIQG